MPQRKTFGRRNPPQIKPPAPVLHAPEGLGGPEPHPPRRLRSLVVFVTVWGLATLVGLAFAQRNRCANDDWSDAKDTNCRSNGGGSRFGFHWGGGGATPSEAHGATFGGFGATGASGAHGGGGE